MLRRRLGFKELEVAYQPIVDTTTGALFAHEVLCRPKHETLSNPQDFFDEAIRSEVVGELGRLIRELAVSACPDWPLFLNVHPMELEEGWLIRPDDPIFLHGHPVYVEITESVPMSKGSHTHGQLTELRHKGVAIVVDDLGAGYSNLKYIADLEPAVVKLDRALITEITSDRVFRLVRAIVRMCHDLDARVVAEGIERPEELAGVQAAGVDLVQGYLVARPAAKPPLPEGWANLFPRRAPLARGRSEAGSMSPLPPVPLARPGSGTSGPGGTSGAGSSRSPYESGSNPSVGPGATAGGSGSSTPGSEGG
jgi:EAL domain-containing protein (putative c-di-GMP-specific phosphodiesterase class I)